MDTSHWKASLLMLLFVWDGCLYQTECNDCTYFMKIKLIRILLFVILRSRYMMERRLTTVCIIFFPKMLHGIYSVTIKHDQKNYGTEEQKHATMIISYGT